MLKKIHIIINILNYVIYKIIQNLLVLVYVLQKIKINIKIVWDIVLKIKLLNLKIIIKILEFVNYVIKK